MIESAWHADRDRFERQPSSLDLADTATLVVEELSVPSGTADDTPYLNSQLIGPVLEAECKILEYSTS